MAQTHTLTQHRARPKEFSKENQYSKIQSIFNGAISINMRVYLVAVGALPNRPAGLNWCCLHSLALNPASPHALAGQPISCACSVVFSTNRNNFSSFTACIIHPGISLCLIEPVLLAKRQAARRSTVSIAWKVASVEVQVLCESGYVASFGAGLLRH